MVAPKATGTGTTLTCTLSPGDVETSFLAVNPAENTGTVGVVVLNQALPNITNPLLRVDTNTFLPHQAVVDYEVIGGGASILEKTIPATGATVPSAGGLGSIAVQMLPAGSVPATLAAGTFIRTTFHIEGKLVDGSSVHTSEREYLFQICTTPGCAANPCL